MFHIDITPPQARIRGSVMAVILLFGANWHIALFPLVTTDIANDYIPWFDHIVGAGMVTAFAKPFGAYSPPYLYLLALATPLKGLIADVVIIKIVAMMGNLAAAVAFWRLLRALRIDDAPRLALCLLALPSLMINAAMLGQSDAMYIAPVLMAISAVMERRHRAMLAWCGLALAVKMQTVLIGPFILVILVARQVPFRYWLITPATYILTLTPAWAAGWPIDDLLTIYFRQATTFNDLARNAPNIWMVASELGFNGNVVVGLASVSAIGAIATYLARYIATARNFSPEMLLRLALLAPLMVAGLLPKMHERYFLLADILSVALAIVSRAPRTWLVPVAIQLGSLFGLFGYGMGLPWLAALGAVPMISATILVARPLLWRGANDNPLLMRAA
ncbi:MAG: hypothetical protein C0476_10445 [Sphingomonas sp.]|nr:hypothetical protein [Sphingomonas sp.]